VGKLNYPTIIRPDIAFGVSVESVSLSTKDHSLGCNSMDSQVLNKGHLYVDCGHTRVTDWTRSLIDR